MLMFPPTVTVTVSTDGTKLAYGLEAAGGPPYRSSMNVAQVTLVNGVATVGAATVLASGAYDVAVIFSQDQDLSEVADEVRAISIAQQRWIKVACAFPVSPAYANTRGVNKTDWETFDRALYDGCIDATDYRKGFVP